MRLSLLAFALLAAPVLAQPAAEPLRPGDVEAPALDSYEHQYRVFVKQGAASAGMPYGSMTETFSIEDGVALSTVHVNAPGQIQKDSVWFAWPSLDPIRSRSEVNGAVQEFTFDGLSASGTLRNGTAFQGSFDSPLFTGGVTDILARTLPMEEGATLSFYAFDEDAEGYESTSTITVGGTSDVLGRTARAITSDDGEQVVTMHLDEETGEMLQLAFDPQPGITVEIRRSDLAE